MPVAATIHHGTLPLLLSKPPPSRGPRGVLDAATVDLIAETAAWEAGAEFLGYAYDKKIIPAAGWFSMWVQSIEPEEENDLVTRVRVSCIGLSQDDEKRKRSLSAAGQQIAVGPFERVILVWNTEETGAETDGDPVDHVKRRVPKLDGDGEVVYKSISTPSGVSKRWNVRDAILVVNDSYFTTKKPDTDVIGTQMVPPNAPTAPAYIWGGYTEPMRLNHPNDWVLDDRRIEELFSESDTDGLWAVTDTFGYYYIAVPD